MTPRVEEAKPAYHGIKVLATVAASLCILTVAMTLGLGHLYMMAVAIAMVPLLSYAMGKRMLHGLAVEREVADVAWDGQSVSVKVHVRNPSSVPKYFLQAKDTLPKGAQFVGSDGVIPLAVPAKGVQVAQYQVVFRYRGKYRLGPLDVCATDPLGMFFFTHRLPAQTEILVLPSPLPLREMDICRGVFYSAAGVHSAPVRGDSVEFLGIREYAPGDPLRRVDWKHSARYGQLFVRDFERFTQSEACVLLDCSASMRQAPDTFEVMVRAASSALHVAYAGGLPFRMLTGQPEVDTLPARWSSEQLYHYLYVLAEVAPRAEFDWAGLVAKSVAEVPPGTLLFLVTASPDRRLLPLLHSCRRKQIQVVLLLPKASAVDAPYDGEFTRALTALGAVVVPLHSGGGV